MILRRLILPLALLCLMIGAQPASATCTAPCTKAQIDADTAANFPDNVTGAITPQTVRTWQNNLVNSTMPTAPVVSGNFPAFDGTTGLQKDSGYSPSTFISAFCTLVPNTCAFLFGYANIVWWGAVADNSTGHATVNAAAFNSALATGHKAIAPYSASAGYNVGANTITMVTGNVLECENTNVTIYSQAAKIISLTSNGGPDYTTVRYCNLNGEVGSQGATANSVGVFMDTTLANVNWVWLDNISCLYLYHCFDDANSAFGVNFLRAKNIYTTETFGTQFRSRNTTGGSTAGNYDLDGLNCDFTNEPPATNVAWSCGLFINFQGMKHGQLIATGYGNGTPAFLANTPAWQFNGASQGGAMTGYGCLYADNTTGSGISINVLYLTESCIYSSINLGAQLILTGGAQADITNMLLFGPHGLTGAQASTDLLQLNGQTKTNIVNLLGTGSTAGVINYFGASANVNISNINVYGNQGYIVDLPSGGGNSEDYLNIFAGQWDGAGTGAINNAIAATHLCYLNIAGVASSCFTDGLTVLGAETVNSTFTTLGNVIFGSGIGAAVKNNYLNWDSGTGRVTETTFGTNVPGALGANLNASGGIVSPTPTRAGDVPYWTGSAWSSLAGNNSGTNCLSENSSGVPSWAACSGGGGSGTVTSVGFTGGLISVGTPTTTPAFTVAGTSGGIPYFSSASTWATSAALAANALVIGGGTGVAPATTTTGTGVVTALGVNTGSAGSFVVNGGALGTPSSGVATNLTGTASGLTAGNVTTNANLTGAVTSTGNATLLGSFSSANLAGALTDETGSGAAVFGTSPTIASPAFSGTSTGTYTLGGTLTINAHTLGGSISGGGQTITNLASLGIRDTSAAFDVTLGATSSTTLTAGRALTIDVVNAARTLKLGSNLTLATDPGAVTGALKSNGSGTFAQAACADLSNAGAGCTAATMTASVGGLVPTPPNNTTTFLRGDGTFATPAGGGTVTSIATTSPITGGTITSTGTIACATCVTSAAALTLNALVIGGGLQASSTTTTGTGVLTALGTNTGSAGAFVVNGGALGTPSSGTATNLTGTAAGLTAGVASAVAVGGITGLGTGVATALGNTAGGTGGFALQSSVVTGANPTGTVGLTTVNGSAATFLRSDGAPALSQAIAPTWTAQHIFSQATTITSATAAALDDIKIAAATTTITGNTGTPITRLAKMGLYKPTFTDSSVVTVTNADTLYIDGCPIAAGSVTITNCNALETGGGNSIFNTGGTNPVGIIRASNNSGYNILSLNGGTSFASGLNGDFASNNGSDTLTHYYAAVSVHDWYIQGVDTMQLTTTALIGSTTNTISLGGTGKLFSGLWVNLATDAANTDNTVCVNGSGQFLKGSGTLGICLGTSGAQFKTAFAPMAVGMDEIAKLNLINYRYRDGFGDGGERMQYGLTAQDVAGVMPDLVRYDDHGTAINFDLGAFVPISMHALQQLNERIVRLENRK